MSQPLFSIEHVRREFTVCQLKFTQGVPSDAEATLVAKMPGVLMEICQDETLRPKFEIIHPQYKCLRFVLSWEDGIQINGQEWSRIMAELETACPELFADQHQFGAGS